MDVAEYNAGRSAYRYPTEITEMKETTFRFSTSPANLNRRIQSLDSVLVDFVQIRSHRLRNIQPPVDEKEGRDESVGHLETHLPPQRLVPTRAGRGPQPSREPPDSTESASTERVVVGVGSPSLRLSPKSCDSFPYSAPSSLCVPNPIL